MIRIIIGDGNAIAREGLRVILSGLPGIVLAGEARNQAETYQLARLGSWDVLLYDIGSPGRETGVEFVRELSRNCKAGAVLILSMYPEDPYAIHVLRAGAAGYLLKDATADELVNAVRKVASGQTCISSEVARMMVRQLKGSDLQLHEKLSEREFEVLASLGAGHTPTQIARRLTLSPKTIGTYRTRVLQKMFVKTTAELMMYAIQHGLVPGLNPYGMESRIRGESGAAMPDTRDGRMTAVHPTGLEITAPMTYALLCSCGTVCNSLEGENTTSAPALEPLARQSAQ
jgi:two-component system invasion response regulator UvrY